MANPYLSEIRIFAFNFAPRNWAKCDGQLIAINTNQSLYSLLGTMYGGDGRTTFGLPDLRGRVPIHLNSIYQQGDKGGQEFHTLSITEIAAHKHAVKALAAAVSESSPSVNMWASAAEAQAYRQAATGKMAATAVGNAGGSQAHENRMPYLALTMGIALQGTFPSRN